AHAARDARASPPFPVARMLRDRPGPACGTGMPTAWPGVRAKNGLAITPRHRRSDARAVLFLRPATIAAGSIAARIRHAAWHRQHPYRPGELAANPGIAGRPCPAWAWPLAPLHLP